MTDTTKTGLVTRRRVLQGASALGLGLAMTGVAAPALRAQGGRPIRFLNCETGRDTLAFFDRIKAEYEAQTGIEIVVDSVPLGEAFTKITNGVRSGTPYDVANVGFVGHVLLLADEGHIAPLNELTDPYEWGNNILFPVDGKVYWYPFDYNLSVIYYRKDLYEKHGLTVPDTWDAFVANCEATVEGRQKGCLFPIGSNGATNWMSFAFMWAEGVELFDDAWNVVLDNETMKPKAAAYLDFMERLYPTMPPGAIQADYATVLSNIVGGTIAHGPYAGRVLEAAERDNPALAEQLDIMPYMDQSGQRKAVSHGYDGWVVLNTDNTGRAMDFMRWLTTDRLIDFLHTAPVHFQPTRLDIYDNDQWRSNPLIGKYGAQIETMRRMVSDDAMLVTSIDTQGPHPDMRPGKVFEAFVMPEMLQDKLIRGLSSAEAVDRAAARMRELVG